ncbi:dehydrodolichyl diphosphate synthase complex subunit nus1-like [Ornithodoros turicata]|uniref:dehydrodolichyl diphosphate synthase complex subunit nus1-like n=1 Tax=Ornithodoros turicata TaxID=34597 RepID=UPI003138AA21
MLFITRVLCRLILILIHLWMRIVEKLLLVKHKVIHRLRHWAVSVTPSHRVKLEHSATFDRRLATLKKLPKHLAIVIAESVVSYRDIANLVVWCLFVRIPYVTVYDVEGAVKKNWPQLYEEVLCSQKRNFGYSNPAEVVLHVQQKGLPEKNGHNGYKRRVHLRLSGSQDGRPLLVDATQRICGLVQGGVVGWEDVTPELIRTHISEWPDPDVLLRLGNVHSLLGYQPWELRLTEIISLPTHKDVTLSEFLDVLYTYSNCDQRFGK